MTPAELLAATATDALDDAKRPWFVQNPGGYPQSIRTSGVVYLIAEAFDQPPYVPTSQYIAAWDPTVTEAVVVLVEATARWHKHCIAEKQMKAHGPCSQAGAALDLCAAWWASRGVEPVAATP